MQRRPGVLLTVRTVPGSLCRNILGLGKFNLVEDGTVPSSPLSTTANGTVPGTCWYCTVLEYCTLREYLWPRQASTVPDTVNTVGLGNFNWVKDETANDAKCKFCRSEMTILITE